MLSILFLRQRRLSSCSFLTELNLYLPKSVGLNLYPSIKFNWRKPKIFLQNNLS